MIWGVETQSLSAASGSRLSGWKAWPLVLAERNRTETPLRLDVATQRSRKKHNGLASCTVVGFLMVDFFIFVFTNDCQGQA